jgi:hypothetical protein
MRRQFDKFAKILSGQGSSRFSGGWRPVSGFWTPMVRSPSDLKSDPPPDWIPAFAGMTGDWKGGCIPNDISTH